MRFFRERFAGLAAQTAQVRSLWLLSVLPVLVLAALAAWLLLPAGGTPAQPVLPTVPHYKCYGITGTAPLPPISVTLENQFGIKTGVLIGAPIQLCPPALKTFGAPPPEGNLTEPHLKCFDILSPLDTGPGVIVDLETQFGVETNVPVGPLFAMCVPALKQVLFPVFQPFPPGPLPTVPHYTCYEIFDPSGPGAIVDLETQFGLETSVPVLQAQALCTPALKTIDGVFPPVTEGSLTVPHLKCYFISGDPLAPAWIVDLLTQFGFEEAVQVEFPETLCVPAIKTVVSTAGLQPAIFSVRPPDIVIPGCEPAALLTLPGFGAPCPPRPPLAPDLVSAPAPLGLDVVGGPGTDNLDAYSLSEPLGGGPPDLHFSVDSLAVGFPCPIPDVSSEAALAEAHGDIFRSLPFPSGCNSQFQDEVLQGLIDPALVPGAIIDDMDALAEPVAGGPCVDPAGAAIPCAVFSVDFGSPVTTAIGGLFDPFGTPIFPSDLLVAPGTPATGIMPGPCPLVLAGLPCVAVPGTMLGLDLVGIAGLDDLDAVCWFDFNGNGLPDLPIMVGGPDDYFYSITGISASIGAFGLSGGDVLAPVGGIPAVVAAAPTIGLLPDPDGGGPLLGDELDAMKCLQVQDVPTATVVTEIHDTAHSPVTSVVVGDTVHDKATVSGGGPIPTGSVTFDWFTNGTCTGAAAATSGAFALVGGSVDATTFTQTPATATSHSFQAHYSGDGVYTAADSPCEPLTVTPVPPPTVPHYKCYKITGTTPAVSVTIDTQFGSETLDVGTPDLLCPPAIKTIVGTGTGVDEGDLNEPHLKCYDILGVDPPDIVDLRTQFGLETNVAVGPARELCIPALKTVISPAQVDISGAWDLAITGTITTTCDLTLVQSGTALTGTVTCPVIGATSVSGTISPATGVFSMSGVDLTLTGTASLDGSSMSGSWSQTTFGSGTFTGVRVLPTVPTVPHYVCYEIIGDGPGVIVDLTTQFPKEFNVVVGQANRLCAPALKTLLPDGTPQGDLGVPHLKCYIIAGPAPDPTIVVNLQTQFPPETGVEVGIPDRLCVPALKTVVSKADPTVVTEIHDTSHNVVTSVPVGTTVHDEATVSGGFGTPTGSVTFDWFTNGTCSGLPAATSGAFALVSGTVDATTFTQTPASATSHSFQAHYSGDGVYNAADSACEPLTVTAGEPHYECYDIVDEPPGFGVTLQTQFGVDEVDVGSANFLCPPTIKTVGTAVFGTLNAPHLKCYDIFGSDPTHVVNLTTQFGLEENVAVGQARLLCVPALKTVVFPIIDLLPVPGPLPAVPHYECYDIDGPAPDIGVTLNNQFGAETVNVGPAKFLCAPAIKTVVGSGLPGEGDLAAPHLKCYDVLAASPAFIVDLETQFGIETSVNVEQAKLLCVPAVKVVVCIADFDADGWCDAVDNCPTVATVWFVPVGDTDCDGFPSSVGVAGKGAETDIGTDPNNPCAANNVANNEGLPDHWPFDFNDNQRADLGDVLGYIPVFNSFFPFPPYDPRFDLDFSGGITLGDVLSFIPVFNLTC